MIEKFSDEELKQILKELGIDEGNLKRAKIPKKEALASEKKEIHSVLDGKPFRPQLTFDAVIKIIDHSLNNIRNVGKVGDRILCSPEIKREDLDEYRQMFQEIIEIIKKHNRKWEGENQ